MAKQAKEIGTGAHARGKSRSKAASKSSLKWIEPNINQGDRAAIRASLDNAPNHVFDVLAALPVGYVFTVRYNEHMDRWQCQVMCFADGDPNYQHAIVGRGSTPINAAITVCYILDAKVEEVWHDGSGIEEESDFG